LIRSSRHSIAPFHTLCVRCARRPKLHAELRRPGEHRGVPALKTLAQHRAQLTVQRTRALAALHAQAVGRIGTQESGPIRIARRQWRGIRSTPVSAHTSLPTPARAALSRALRIAVDRDPCRAP